MEITEIEQLTQDFDWFAVDDNEAIAHFASAGKLLPKSIAASREDSETVRKFFRSLSANRSNAITDSEYGKFAHPDGDSIPMKYLKDFLYMSNRGLYSYDTPLKGDRSMYFRVAIPLNPLKFSELPNDIKTIAGRMKINGSFLDLQLLVDINL